MIIIRTDKAISCTKCGSNKKLVECTVNIKDERITNIPYNAVYCQKCLNKFEEDEDNYFVMDH